jgi:hypothetical protein
VELRVFSVSLCVTPSFFLHRDPQRRHGEP